MRKRATSKLATFAIQKAKAPTDGKPYRLADGGGLYLQVSTTGSKLWRIKYRFAGQDRPPLALGKFGNQPPALTLEQARQELAKVKAQLAAGQDPRALRQQAKLAAKRAAVETFEALASEWLEEVHIKKAVSTHYNRNVSRLERFVYPAIGQRAIKSIEPLDLLEILRRIERTGKAETANRVRTLCSQIFRYAVRTGRADRDPAADLRGALATPDVKHRATLLDENEIGALLRAIDDYPGHPATRIALQLAPLVFVRPGELRTAQWSDFDLEAGLWNFKPSKNGVPVITPLPAQALALLNELRLVTGRSAYLFHSPRSAKRPLSEAAMIAALHRMGYKDKMTVHGFRAMARTLLVESLGFPAEYVEQQLAHAVKDANGRAYNRTTFLDQRRDMLQTWADFLDRLKAGDATVVPMRRAGNRAR